MDKSYPNKPETQEDKLVLVKKKMIIQKKKTTQKIFMIQKT